MQQIKLLAVIGLCANLFTACSTPSSTVLNSQDIKTVKAIFDEYKNYPKINDTLKVSPTHGGKYVFTHINSLGIDSYRNKKFPYADGTIAVKEAHGSSDPNSAIDTLFVMKKMAGFDKDNGDWYYAMTDGKGNTKDSGKIQMCITCHKTTAKDKDYIVGF
ncbi:MAG: cytochrome P460 family protein [Cyanobacteriota bacterium]